MGRIYLSGAMFVLLSISPTFGQYVTVIQALQPGHIKSLCPWPIGRRFARGVH